MMKLRTSFLLFILFVLFSAVFLFGTTWGLILVQKGVNNFSGGAVTVGSVAGRLATSYTLRDIHLKTPVANIDIEKLQWAWRPMSLLKGELDVISYKITKLDVQMRSVKSVSEKEADAPSLHAFFPLKHLLVQDFSVEGIGIKDTDGDLVFQLFTFNTSLDYQDGLIVVNSFNAEGPDIGLAFHGNAALQEERNLDLMGNWHLAGFGFHSSKGTFSLKGPIDSLGIRVSLHDPGEIHVVGVIKDILDTASWTADVDAKNVNLKTWIHHCPEIILSKVHADMSGDFGHYRGLVVADGLWGVADNLQLRSNIDGDGLGIVFSSLRVDRKKSSAIATNASISWEKLFSWDADLAFDNFALDMFFPEFNGLISSRFHSVGDVTEQGLEASFGLQSMNGRFAEYVWSATGNIGLTEERIFSHDIQIKSDSVGGIAFVRDVELSWVDKLSWKANVDFDHFDPGFLHPMVAGSIDGNITSTLEWNEELPVGALNISHLSGELRGGELSGGGSIAINGTALSTTGFFLSLGESELHVTGKVNETLGLQFAFDSSDLSEIGENLFGELKVQALVSGTKDLPNIDFNVAGKDLRAENQKIKKLSGHLKTTFGTTGAIDGGLVLEDAIIQGIVLTKADLSVSGTASNHKVLSEMRGPDGELNFNLAGKYEKGWLGTLSDLTLRTKSYGEWKQSDSSNIVHSLDESRVQDFCVANLAAGENNQTCFSAWLDGSDEGKWSVSADMMSFELESLGGMDHGLPPITGPVDATLTANGDKHGVILADGYINIPEMDSLLNVTNSDFVSVQLRDSVLKAHLEDEQLALNLFFRDNKGGSMDLEAQAQGVGRFDTLLTSRPIAGKFTLDKYDLSSLAAFTGYGVEPTGWVSSSFELGGTIGQPEVYGELAIQEGGLELPYQGITLNNVVIAIDSRESGAIVRGGASSDGGQLEVDGFITHGKEGVEATLQLKGENFLLVNLPEYSLRVSPDGEMKINKNRGQIRGRVTVPSGLIAPEELSGAVKVSEDVVFLGEEKVHVKNGYPFFLDLDVTLGDDVRVDGYGLEGRLGGNLNVKITPTDFITGRGELDLLDSTFSFYGRSLDIARGRMLFTGGPIDNPGVDIRAQKVVTAETARDDEYTVGVDINGLVQDLQFHLFSDPFMEDTDILSQMVVGHSFATSSEEEGSLLQAAAMTLGLSGSSKLMEGIGNLLLIDDLHLEGSTKKEDVSLVVGKRITEDLYIGYDMNMFSQLGQFRVRYDLSRGFYVETRSSSESTGADLIYTFRR